MGVLGPPVSPALQSGAPPAPAPLPHAPLPRRPLLRSRGKSSFKNTSSKAPSVSGGGCRGRGGREGDAAALDTEVTGQGGGRGRRAGVHRGTRVCVHREHLALSCLSFPPHSGLDGLMPGWQPHPHCLVPSQLWPVHGVPHGCWATPALLLLSGCISHTDPNTRSKHQSVGRGPSWVLLPLGS